MLLKRINQMINITNTFQYQLYEFFRGNPGALDTRLVIPYLTKTGRKTVADYKGKAYLPNPVFPLELYEYRRDTEIKLSIEGKIKSQFAKENIEPNIYHNPDMRDRVCAIIDLCRQNMNNKLEQELDDNIRVREQMDDAADSGSLEYHYDLYETVKTFNDFLCITFLHLANILTYPNETFYEKFTRNAVRIKPDDALRMANKICARMQAEFEDVILENFPIFETVERLSKVERNTEPKFDAKDIKLEPKTTKVKVIKKSKTVTEKDK